MDQVLPVAGFNWRFFEVVEETIDDGLDILLVCHLVQEIKSFNF